MRRNLEVIKATIAALFLREIQTRFGKYRLGYLWALLEPAVHVMVLVMVRGFILGRSRPGISFTIFVIAGVVPWLLFRNTAVRSLRAVSSNAGLFNYRAVKPIDTVIARSLVELVIHMVVYALLLYLAWLVLDEPVQINNLPFLTVVFLLFAWFSFGLGLIFMVIGDAYPESHKFIPIAIRPLYFISGIFFSIHNIPDEYHHYIYWNPILHAVELGRHGLFPSYDVPEASLSYLFFCTMAVNFIGLAIYRYREKEMLSS